MKKYYFVLMDYNKSNKISGHAYTLVGVKHIFKKVSNAQTCAVFKKVGISYSNTPFVTYQK